MLLQLSTEQDLIGSPNRTYKKVFCWFKFLHRTLFFCVEHIFVCVDDIFKFYSELLYIVLIFFPGKLALLAFCATVFFCQPSATGTHKRSLGFRY
jgi:hypothetical protein